MKYSIVYLFLCFFELSGSQIFGQVATWIFFKDFDYEIQDIYIDRLNHIYTLDADNRLRKYNSKGIFLNQYYNTLYGVPASVNLTNPFQPLIYYGGIAKIVLLDANLGTVEEIQLNELQLFDIGTISRSMDGNFWVFDNIQSKIKKIDVRGEVLVETMTINMLWKDIKVVDKILDNGNFALGLIKGRGVIVLDVFGNVERKILLPGVRDIYLLDQYLYMVTGDCEFVIENLNTRISEYLNLSENLDCENSRIIPARNMIGILKEGRGQILTTKK